jgi:aspartyl-tRNA(Asn)/glutamyl-tRNA(Gln) amidotransferase subunit A
MAVSGAGQTSELCALGVADLARRYRDGSLSPVEVTRATLERIAALNPRLNAYNTVLADGALAEAEAAARLLRAGVDLGPLHGIPYSVKDIIQVRGTRTTAGSRQLIDAPLDTEDAPVVARLRQAGAVLLGKTNLYEFAAGVPDPQGPFGWVQNPRKIGYQSGSSSSGSGAAVAAGLGVFSLGTDTGGSVRFPAIFCGAVGLKPTYGRVPVRGVLPLSWSLDHVGPLARSVADAAYVLAAIAGHDARDPYSALAPVDDYPGGLSRDLRGLRVGVPTNPFFQDAQRPVLDAYTAALAALRDLGAMLRELELPRVEETPDLTQLIIQAEGSAYHERFRGREDRYDASFREFVLPGREHRAIPYIQARLAMAEMTVAWRELWERVDVIATPACPIVAPPHDVWEIELNGRRHPYRMLATRFTRPFNLCGFPALAMPSGVAPDGLPTSIQLVAPPFAEARLLAVAHQLEAALGVAARLGILVEGEGT